MIIYEAIKRLLYRGGQTLDVGIIIVAVSGVLNYLMGYYSIRTGKKYGSMALVAGGEALQSDTYSTIGLVAGLLVLYFTGLAWIDSALALIWNNNNSYRCLNSKNTISGLLDTADDKLLGELADLLNENREPEWVDIHNTKVIKSGNSIYIDCDLTVPWYYTVSEGHKSGEKLKNVLKGRFNDKVQLTLHLDPCDIFANPKCSGCIFEKCKYKNLR